MEQIAVYGVGTVGSCLATLVIGHSLPCTIIGRSEAGLVRCKEAVARNWDDLIAQGLAREENKIAALNLLTVTNFPNALSSCTFIFEAVAESFAEKQKVYQKILQYADPSAVIASCTSSIDADTLAGQTSRPGQLLIAHPFQPAHMLPLVEVVRSAQTTNETVNRTLTLLKMLHRQIVVLNKSVPGFLINRFAQALFREAICLIENGVTTAADIDRAVKYAIGMRYASIGLMEYFDAVGFALEKSIAENVYPDLCDAKQAQPSILAGIAAGTTGQSVGRGLYDWSQKDSGEFRLRQQAPYYAFVQEWNMPVPPSGSFCDSEENEIASPKPAHAGSAHFASPGSRHGEIAVNGSPSPERHMK